MNTPKQYLGRKAVKATVRHSVRGTAAKARREPPRTLTLLGAGILLGAIAGWLLGRRAGAAADPFPNYEPPVPSATHSTSEAKAAAAA
jgi:hypothetical protein